MKRCSLLSLPITRQHQQTESGSENEEVGEKRDGKKVMVGKSVVEASGTSAHAL